MCSTDSARRRPLPRRRAHSCRQRGFSTYSSVNSTEACSRDSTVSGVDHASWPSAQLKRRAASPTLNSHKVYVKLVTDTQADQSESQENRWPNTPSPPVPLFCHRGRDVQRDRVGRTRLNVGTKLLRSSECRLQDVLVWEALDTNRGQQTMT